jgi:hypothetical protein
MLETAYCFTKYKGIDAMFVAIHQYQLSTFFRAISHIPVYAVAEAKASAHGIAPGKCVRRYVSTTKSTT